MTYGEILRYETDRLFKTLDGEVFDAGMIRAITPRIEFKGDRRTYKLECVDVNDLDRALTKIIEHYEKMRDELHEYKRGVNNAK